MVTLTQLTQFLGWASLINILLLCFMALMLILMRNWVTSMHSKMFAIPASELPLIYYKFMANYKVLTVVFFLVPYLSLKCMGQ